MPTLLALAVSLTSAGGASGGGGAPSPEERRAWADEFENRTVRVELHAAPGFEGSPFLDERLEADPPPGGWGSVRRLPPKEAAELSARPAGALRSPRRRAAAHVALWSLYKNADRPPRPGYLTNFGLHDVGTIYVDRPDGDLDAFAALPADGQRGNAVRWWAEYRAGERTVFSTPPAGARRGRRS